MWKWDKDINIFFGNSIEYLIKLRNYEKRNWKMRKLKCLTANRVSWWNGWFLGKISSNVATYVFRWKIDWTCLREWPQCGHFIAPEPEPLVHSAIFENRFEWVFWIIIPYNYGYIWIMKQCWCIGKVRMTSIRMNAFRFSVQFELSG